MTAPSNINKAQITTTGLSSYSFDSQTVISLIQKGISTANIQDKRQVFDQAYETLVKELTNAQEAKALLAELLTTCADKVFYNQTIDGDSTAGFRKAAILSCISLHLQIPIARDSSLPIMGKTIDELINFYDLQPESYVEVSKILVNNSDQFVHDLDHYSSKDKKNLINTLFKLSYSLQNMPETNDNYLLQKNCQKITIDVLSVPSIEKEFLAHYIDYLYNRGPFITELADKGSENPLAGKDLVLKKIASYQKIEQLLQKHFSPLDPVRLARESQIANNSGMMLFRAGTPVEEILPNFEKAFDLRKQIVEQKPVGSNERYEHEYFLSNIRTGLIHCLVHLITNDPASAKVKDWTQALREHRNGLEAYLKDLDARGDTNTYQEGYKKKIKEADALLNPQT